MAFNRTHALMIGIVVFMVGLQFRIFESVTLNEETSQFIATRLKRTTPDTTSSITNLLSTSTPVPAAKRTIKPPAWVGWAVLSVGAVLVMHSFAMTGPD